MLGGAGVLDEEDSGDHGNCCWPGMPIAVEGSMNPGYCIEYCEDVGVEMIWPDELGVLLLALEEEGDVEGLLS